MSPLSREKRYMSTESLSFTPREDPNMINPEHIEPSEQAEPKQAEPKQAEPKQAELLTLDKETLKDLDLSAEDAATVKGGRQPTGSESCKMDGCSNAPTC